MPKKFPAEFKRDVVMVARRGDLTIVEVASDSDIGRYVAEFDFRYSTRYMRDVERLRTLVTRGAGRRLTYRESSESSASSLVA